MITENIEQEHNDTQELLSQAKENNPLIKNANNLSLILYKVTPSPQNPLSYNHEFPFIKAVIGDDDTTLLLKRSPLFNYEKVAEFKVGDNIRLFNQNFKIESFIFKLFDKNLVISNKNGFLRTINLNDRELAQQIFLNNKKRNNNLSIH